MENLTPEQYNTMENFNQLVEDGYIVQCPRCLEYSAYAWTDINMDSNTGLRLKPDDGFRDGGEEYTEDEILSNWPDVYLIPTSGSFEWECGNCKTNWANADSPILAEVYTHVPVEEA